MHQLTTHIPESHLTLLGKPTRALYEAFGEPFSEVMCGGNTALMFEFDNETVICETHSDLVLSVNAFEDRRISTRIKPQINKAACLSFSEDRHLATVIALSVKSAAIKIIGDALPAEGSKVDFCTILGAWSPSRNHITLTGTVYKVSSQDRRVVVNFDREYKTQSHWLLQEYINHSMLREYLSPIITSRPQTREITIIKSDACSLKCGAKTCILS